VDHLGHVKCVKFNTNFLTVYINLSTSNEYVKQQSRLLSPFGIVPNLIFFSISRLRRSKINREDVFSRVKILLCSAHISRTSAISPRDVRLQHDGKLGKTERRKSSEFLDMKQLGLKRQYKYDTILLSL